MRLLRLRRLLLRRLGRLCLLVVLVWRRWHRHIIFIVIVDFVQDRSGWRKGALHRRGRTVLLGRGTIFFVAFLGGGARLVVRNGFDDGLGRDGTVALRNRDACGGHDFVVHSDVDGFGCNKKKITITFILFPEEGGGLTLFQCGTLSLIAVHTRSRSLRSDERGIRIADGWLMPAKRSRLQQSLVQEVIFRLGDGQLG